MSLDYLRLLIREMAQAQTRHLGIQRKPRLQQLKELVKDPPTRAVRFTNTERANFNPHGEHEEGYGAYVFPLNRYFFEQLMEGQIFFSDYKFIHLFKMPPNVLDVTKSDKRITVKFVKDFLLAIKISPKFAIEVLNNYKDNMLECSKNEAFYRALIDSELAGPNVSNTLRKLGINGFYDPGENIIYSDTVGEGSQAIITNPSSLQFIETMKTDDVLKSEKILKGYADSSDEYRNKLISKTEIGNVKNIDKFTYFAMSDRPGDISYNTIIKMLDYVKNNVNNIKNDVEDTKYKFSDPDTGMQRYAVPKSDKNVTNILFKILDILIYKIKKTPNDDPGDSSKYVRNQFTEKQFENIFNILSEIENLIQNKEETFKKFKSNFNSLKNFKKQKDREEIMKKNI